jgi:hypothetical protein
MIQTACRFPSDTDTDSKPNRFECPYSPGACLFWNRCFHRFFPDCNVRARQRETCQRRAIRSAEPAPALYWSGPTHDIAGRHTPGRTNHDGFPPRYGRNQNSQTFWQKFIDCAPSRWLSRGFRMPCSVAFGCHCCRFRRAARRLTIAPGFS